MFRYFRHMKDVLEEAGVEVTDKKDIDRIIHSLVEVGYKDCSPTWKMVKDHIRQDPQTRERFVLRLKKALGVV
jgi:hypothetical protein